MSFLEPTSVAVIGASAQEGKVGNAIARNLLTQGYKGKIFLINPTHASVLGEKCYPDIHGLPLTPDLAVIVIPAPKVAATLGQCGENGVHNVIIISAGFKETHTAVGEEMEEELRHIAKKYGIALLGPNCLGILRPAIGLNASFAKTLPPTGPIALISQSGAFAVGLLDGASAHHLSFSSVLSIGNKTVLNECDFLEMCAADSATHVIGLYLESIEEGERFCDIALHINKPIVLLKAGTSSFGKHAASSHTGALAGSDGTANAICLETGIRRAHDLEEFTDLLHILSTQPALLSQHIAIVTNAGGPGILAADAAEKYELSLPPLSPEQREKLQAMLPASASVQNPIDVMGDADLSRFAAAIDTCIADPEIDGVCVLLTPQVMTPCMDIARAIADGKKRAPLMPFTVSFIGGESVWGATTFLEENGIPTFPTPERAVRALATLRQRTTRKKIPKKRRRGTDTRAQGTHKILCGASGLLPEQNLQELFTLYGIPLPPSTIVQTPDEGVQEAKRIGFPVVAKIASPDIIHKTDAGGIAIHLQTEEDVRQAVGRILTNIHTAKPNARIDGILIQKFLPIGDEFIIGGLRDPSFGPMIMVGLGGIYTELFRDTTFHTAPLQEQEAYTMLQELTAWPILMGARGRSPDDIVGLAQLLVRTAELLAECGEIQEIDLNPVIVRPDGIAIADAKVVLREKTS